MSYYHENKEFPCFGVTYVDYGGYFSGYPSDPEYNIYRRKTVRQTTSHDGTMYGMLKKLSIQQEVLPNSNMNKMIIPALSLVITRTVILI